jgi:hypothetical protein
VLITLTAQVTPSPQHTGWACLPAVASKLVGQFISANKCGAFVVQYELDELSKQRDSVAATGRLRVHRQDHAPFTNMLVEVCELGRPDIENISGSTQASQVWHTGHELEERNIIEVPRNRDLDQIDRLSEHKRLIA